MITSTVFRRATQVINILVVIVLGVSGAEVNQQEKRAFWEGPPPARAPRVAQAKEWRQGFDALDQQVPTLSPNEAAWIRREYDDQIAANGGKFTPRAIEAMNSREFNVRRARQHLDLLLPVLRRLATAEYRREREEVTDWARCASLIADGPCWSSVEDLLKRGLVKAEVNGLSGFYHATHAMWASVIIERVVIPFLEQGN